MQDRLRRQSRTALLDLPAALSEAHTAYLQKLGLLVARTVEIWPSGIPSLAWDGEGDSEWLNTNPVQIVHDHPVVAYAVRLNNGPDTTVNAHGAGEPLFLRLPQLPAGSYTYSASRHAVTPRPVHPELRRTLKGISSSVSVNRNPGRPGPPPIPALP